jgi:hypothetical protein
MDVLVLLDMLCKARWSERYWQMHCGGGAHQACQVNTGRRSIHIYAGK